MSYKTRLDGSHDSVWNTGWRKWILMFLGRKSSWHTWGYNLWSKAKGFIIPMSSVKMDTSRVTRASSYNFNGSVTEPCPHPSIRIHHFKWVWRWTLELPITCEGRPKHSSFRWVVLNIVTRASWKLSCNFFMVKLLQPMPSIKSTCIQRYNIIPYSSLKYLRSSISILQFCRGDEKNRAFYWIKHFRFDGHFQIWSEHAPLAFYFSAKAVRHIVSYENVDSVIELTEVPMLLTSRPFCQLVVNPWSVQCNRQFISQSGPCENKRSWSMQITLLFLSVFLCVHCPEWMLWMSYKDLMMG